MLGFRSLPEISQSNLLEYILKENHILVKNTRSRVRLPGLQAGTYHFSKSVSSVINEDNSMTILSRVVMRNKHNIHKEQNRNFGIQ